MKATTKFYVYPHKGQHCEVVPVISNNVDGRGQGSITLRFHAMGEDAPNGELNIKMDRFEALSLAAEIVLKVARGKM
jgi:hypothetical protein